MLHPAPWRTPISHIALLAAVEDSMLHHLMDVRRGDTLGELRALLAYSITGRWSPPCLEHDPWMPPDLLTVPSRHSSM
jgi:hypothetical protein